MCYKQSQECWGGEAPAMVENKLVSTCQAHVAGRTKKPVVRVEVHGGVLKGYAEIEQYLTPFIRDELNHVEGVSVYGTGQAEMPVEVYAWKYGFGKGSGEPTHLLIAWDFKDQAIFNRLDGLLDRGTVIESVTI